MFDSEAVLGAMEHSLAMIEMDSEGNVLWVNDLFAKAMGYQVYEMIGLQHKQFCTPEFVYSPEYRELWDS